jgi:hypothetical protein
VIARLVADALKEAVAKFQGKPASPDICGRIKREFVHIMRVKHRIDWSRHARKIEVEFIDGRTPNVVLPKDLMQRSLH